MKKIKISQTSLNMNVNAFLLLSLSLFSCKSNKAQLPKEVESSLILAGENKKELERVIRHFSKHGKDSLKLRSAYFLISNMPYHTSTLVKNESTCLLPFIELADKKLYEIFKGCHVDSLATESFAREVEKIGEIIKIKMKNKTFEEKIHYQSTASDIEVFGSDFLINHIENAFKLRESPIVSLLSFDDFCEYILPYRLVQYKTYQKTEKIIMICFTNT